MAGIYIHIPFCKQACHYCDFHFSTNPDGKQAMVAAIGRELEWQKNYLGPEKVGSIYFGGGTPSLLDAGELGYLLDIVARHFVWEEEVEITLEANPDDLTGEKLRGFRQAGINRLSIGIQSFDDNHLQYLNRAHNAGEARAALERAREAGFDNVSIDLIYGIPSAGDTVWKSDLAHAIALRPEHISSYCLTIEPRTVFGQWLKKGKIKAPDDEFEARQFEILLETLTRAGYEQYEISNFSLPGYHSRHNSNYWKQQKYLGAGPSAHSYNGKLRQYNVRNNAQYLKAIEREEIPFEPDNLEQKDHLNEYIMTSLRTKWGCDLLKVETDFSLDLWDRNRPYLEGLMENQLIKLDRNHIILTDSGKLLADRIASDLFMT